MPLVDSLIVVLYLSAVLFIGIRFGKRGESMEGYVVGGRQVPWLAVLGSLIATEISAATFLGTPGVGYAENMGYLQMGVGSLFSPVRHRFSLSRGFLQASLPIDLPIPGRSVWRDQPLYGGLLFPALASYGLLSPLDDRLYRPARNPWASLWLDDDRLRPSLPGLRRRRWHQSGHLDRLPSSNRFPDGWRHHDLDASRLGRLVGDH